MDWIFVVQESASTIAGIGSFIVGVIVLRRKDIPQSKGEPTDQDANNEND